LFFHDEQGDKTKQAILSVKAGHVNVSHVRDLRGVLDREQAAIGVLISMEPLTRPMREEATTPEATKDRRDSGYPRMQLARKVAKDRVISMVDFEGRHGHKVRFRLVTAT
jgi:hypothetical protein